MLLQPILTLVALAATVAAGAIPAAQSTPPHTIRKVTSIPAFNITNFEAGAVVLSHRDYYHFNLTFCPTLPQIECSALGTTMSESLGSIPLTKCGGDGKVAFQWTAHDDGSAELSIVRGIDGEGVATEEARYAVPSNHTVVVGQGKFAHAVYEGPENFSVPAWRIEVVTV